MIEVNDRVIVTDESGKEWFGTVVNISEYRPPEMKYAVDLDEYKDDFVFVGEEKIKPETEISEMVTIDEVFMPYMIDSHGSTMYQLFASKVLQISSGQNKVEDEE